MAGYFLDNTATIYNAQSARLGIPQSVVGYATDDGQIHYVKVDPSMVQMLLTTEPDPTHESGSLSQGGNSSGNANSSATDPSSENAQAASPDLGSWGKDTATGLGLVGGMMTGGLGAMVGLGAYGYGLATTGTPMSTMGAISDVAGLSNGLGSAVSQGYGQAAALGPNMSAETAMSPSEQDAANGFSGFGGMGSVGIGDPSMNAEAAQGPSAQDAAQGFGGFGSETAGDPNGGGSAGAASDGSAGGESSSAGGEGDGSSGVAATGGFVGPNWGKGIMGNPQQQMPDTGPSSGFKLGGLVAPDHIVQAIQKKSYAEGGDVQPGDPNAPNSPVDQAARASMGPEAQADDVNAKVSKGEYILDAATVAFYGVKFIQNLQKQAHTAIMQQQAQQDQGGGQGMMAPPQGAPAPAPQGAAPQGQPTPPMPSQAPPASAPNPTEQRIMATNNPTPKSGLLTTGI